VKITTRKLNFKRTLKERSKFKQKREQKGALVYLIARSSAFPANDAPREAHDHSVSAATEDRFKGAGGEEARRALIKPNSTTMEDEWKAMFDSLWFVISSFGGAHVLFASSVVFSLSIRMTGCLGLRDWLDTEDSCETFLCSERRAAISNKERGALAQHLHAAGCFFVEELLSSFNMKGGAADEGGEDEDDAEIQVCCAKGEGKFPESSWTAAR